MKIKSQVTGKMHDAKLDTDYYESGRPVAIADGHMLLTTFLWTTFWEVVEATDTERAAFRAAGYEC